ncbi:TspO/MBR family protein [Namhaeicola litoreus]|uniref:TspO/MBR family protein n=1 Tax=Namhaeicola litoreus TaxID=1052145 RepID=A0ABW3Y553_9FLAO
MNKLFKNLLLFLFINFGSLALGGLLMNNGPQAEWYNSLEKAPWTPPGWVFGFAWTTIMICFSVYMAFLFLKRTDFPLKLLFTIQVLLNISWNYFFFNIHWVNMAMFILISLTVVVFIFLFSFRKEMKWLTLLILPYALWLLVACSLNLYFSMYN